jgi:serine/threonine-protein kinase
LPADTPASVRSLIRRCLDRDPRTRLRDIGEARVALSSAAIAGAGAGESGGGAGTQGATGAAPAGRGTRVLPWALVIALGLVAAFALWRGSAETVDGDLLTLSAPFGVDLELPNTQEGVLALSPDGKTLALTLQRDAVTMLYVRRLDSAALVPMPGTEGASSPFFSPDGAWIAFFAEDKLKKVPVGGGAPVTLCDSDGNNRGGDWSTDDVIVFSPHYTRPLMRVSGAGGEPTVLTTIDKARGERTHRWPQAVANEDLVLFTVGTMDSPESYDDARIEAIRPSTGERRTVLERASMARYVASGHLVFGREGFLFAVPFDVGRLEVLGSPVPVLEAVMGNRSSGVVHAGFARNGLMTYIAGAPRSMRSRLVLRDRDGRTEPLAAAVAGYVNPRLAPDRSRIAVQVAGDSSFDIWTYDLATETSTRLTFEGNNAQPMWSPDGRRIAFASVRDDALMSTYVKAADGSGQAELVYSADRFENAGQVMPRGWTPDGRTLILEFTDENSTNIASLVEGEDEATVLLASPAAESYPVLSPNGRWMAYVSDEAGDFQVFVRAYPGPGGKWQVSNTGGVAPLWSADGRELFYRWQEALWAVKVDEGSGGFRAGRPAVVLDGLPPASSLFDYDVFDAERFLLVENVGDDTAPKGVTVMVNWLADLERRVPR